MDKGKTVGLIAVVLVIWSAFFAALLSGQQEEIKAATGNVWTVVDTATAAIDGVDSSLQADMEYSTKVVEMQTQARQYGALLEAAKAGKDLTQVMEIIAQMQTFQVTVESAQAFPDLSDVQVAQMDNLVGQLSRVNHARQELIDAQKSYNQMRIWAGPVGWLFYDRIPIVGERYDASQPAPRSKFDQGQ